MIQFQTRKRGCFNDPESSPLFWCIAFTYPDRTNLGYARLINRDVHRPNLTPHLCARASRVCSEGVLGINCASAYWTSERRFDEAAAVTCRRCCTRPLLKAHDQGVRQNVGASECYGAGEFHSVSKSWTFIDRIDPKGT